jgi:hypothetical protein
MNLDEISKIIQDKKLSKSATKEYIDTIKNCLKHLNSTNIYDIYNNYEKILDFYKNKSIKYKTTKFTNLKCILGLMNSEQLANINNPDKFRLINLNEEIEYDEEDEEEEEEINQEPLNINNKIDILNNKISSLYNMNNKHEEDIVLLKNMFLSLISDNSKNNLLSYSVTKIFQD